MMAEPIRISRLGIEAMASRLGIPDDADCLERVLVRRRIVVVEETPEEHG